MSNEDIIWTYFRCFLSCLQSYFIGAKGVDVGGAHIRDWVLLDYRKRLIYSYTMTLIIVVIIIACVLYIA